MAKLNQGLYALIEKTVKRNLGQTCIRRDGRVVYEVHNNPHTVDLYHYGTLILTYNPAARQIVRFGGWSASDRDALNTALTYFGHDSERFSIAGGELHTYSTAAPRGWSEVQV
jgi:hypothetical protein